MSAKVLVEMRILRAGQETGTGLGRGTPHLAMSAHAGLWKQLLEPHEQRQELLFLLGCARVFGTTLRVESALVADAYAATVVGAAMGTHLKQRPMLGDDAVAADVEVVAHGAKTAQAVIVEQLKGGVVAVFACGGAMYHEPAHVFFSHFLSG